MFSRFSRAIKAVVEDLSETLAPSRPPLEEFKLSWQHVTDYVMLVEDRELQVEATDVPFHLHLMIEILKKEEEEHDNAGPCMEHMLRANILKTAVSLGQADYPSGMMKAILRFCTELLASIAQPLLPHVGVHGPLLRLMQCCLQRAGGKTEELEFVNFLCAVCGKLVEDPSLATFFLKADSPAGQAAQKASTFLLPEALCALCLSHDAVVATRAFEGLTVVMTLQPPHVAEAIVGETRVCDRMAEELVSRLKRLPLHTRDASPALVRMIDIWMSERGARQLPEQCDAASPEDVQAFLMFMSWLQLCDEIASRANQLVASSLSIAIAAKFLQAECGPRLAQASESAVTMATDCMTTCLAQLSAPTLVLAFIRFFVDSDSAQPDTPAEMERLLGRCDDMSDEVSLASLRLVACILQTRNEHAHVTLLLSQLQETERPLPALDQAAASLLADQLLNIVPGELRTAEATSYREYIAAAHDLLRDWTRACRRWKGEYASALPTAEASPTWPLQRPPTPPPPPPARIASCSSPLVAVVFRRLRRVCEQPYAVNLVLTSIVSSLFSVPNVALHGFLLYGQPESLLSVLAMVGQEVQVKAARVPDIAGQLRAVRTELSGPGDSPRPTPLVRYLRAVVLLEEFTKELASIAAVWANPTLMADV